MKKVFFSELSIKCCLITGTPRVMISFHSAKTRKEYKTEMYRFEFYLISPYTDSSLSGSAVVSWLVRSTPDRAVLNQAQLGTLCCVLGQDTLLSHCPRPPPRCINGCQ